MASTLVGAHPVRDRDLSAGRAGRPRGAPTKERSRSPVGASNAMPIADELCEDAHRNLVRGLRADGDADRCAQMRQCVGQLGQGLAYLLETTLAAPTADARRRGGGRFRKGTDWTSGVGGK